ncbi:EAL domain-containing protein [Ferrovum sp.]|uniref:EAL domain-containing protein n=1 Tax=Ferrovum sp. TaxID=2609467 RepID=UPI002634F8B6|nr:EAL domain-containing protein [Ferrovum sp.]
MSNHSFNASESEGHGHFPDTGKSFTETILDLAVPLILVIDREGSIVRFNHSAERFTGYSFEEVRQEPFFWARFTETKDRATVRTQFLESLTIPDTQQFVFPWVNRHGLICWFEWNNTVIRDELGNPFLVIIGNDITAQREVQLRMQENERRLLDILNVSPIAVRIATDRGRQVVFHNPRYALLIHNPAAIGDDPQRYYEHPEEYEHILKELAQGHDVLNREIHLLVPGKDQITVLASYMPIQFHGQDAVLGWFYDISELRNFTTQLEHREEEFRRLIEYLPYGILIHQEGKVCLANQKAVQQFNAASTQELLDLPVLDLVHPDFRDIVKERAAATIEKGADNPFIEEKLLCRDGTPFDAEVANLAVTFNGRPGSLVVFSDITERKRVEAQLRINANVFNTSLDGILITDHQNNILDVNPSFTTITGYSRDEVLGQTPSFLKSGKQDEQFYQNLWTMLHEKGNWRGELWNRKKSGEIYAELLSISLIRDAQGQVLHHVGVFTDITNFKNHEKELERIAHYDPLTGLPNRVLLADRMQQTLALSSRSQRLLVIGYLDLDGFKQINDSLGHEIGDQVLIEMALRMKNVLREGDTVARLGGDEFVLLLTGYRDAQESLATLQRLLTQLALPVILNDAPPVSLSASLGLTVYPLDHSDPETLLRHADQAMYSAKQSGKNQIQIYDPEMDSLLRLQQEFRKRFQNALESEELFLLYQPKVDLSNGQLLGVEALIRWHHPERGVLSPQEFLPQISQTHLDSQVGEWVIAQAFIQLGRWQAQGREIPISINISPHHLERPDFIPYLTSRVLAHPTVPPRLLNLEILETLSLDNIQEGGEIIHSCRSLGIGVALDDFGTGYSSLAYLRQLPVDELKIDRSFVRDMVSSATDRAIIQSILSLASAFDCRTVAEGIEDISQYRLLLELGCQAGQGYHIAYPMRAGELIHWKPAFSRPDRKKGSPPAP